MHHGIELRFDGEGHRIDMTALTSGRSITVYGQQEVVKDLIRARLDAGGEIMFEVSDVRVSAVDSSTPKVTFVRDGEDIELNCDIVAGCDGFHGVCRPSIPAGVLSTFERAYPFAWLGILAAAPPTHDELIYAYHRDGFALYSMRSPEVTRLYLQVAPEEDLDNWPDRRIWDNLHARLETGDGWSLREGDVLEKGVTGMRSFVVEPMQYGRMFLAGDAAHIVPPTGAKGMNLALADVRVLAQAATAFFESGQSRPARCVLRYLPEARLARRAFFMVDDVDAPPLSERRRVPAAPAALAARIRRRLARGGRVAGRELCRIAFCRRRSDLG